MMFHLKQFLGAMFFISVLAIAQAADDYLSQPIRDNSIEQWNEYQNTQQDIQNQQRQIQQQQEQLYWKGVQDKWGSTLDRNTFGD